MLLVLAYCLIKKIANLLVCPWHCPLARLAIRFSNFDGFGFIKLLLLKDFVELRILLNNCVSMKIEKKGEIAPQ